MRNFSFIVLSIALFASICEATTNVEECDELKEKELQMTCELSDFDEYRKCIKERKEIRRKRATICPITGKIIDIDALSSSSNETVQTFPASNETVHPIVHTLPASNSTVFVPFTVTGGVVDDPKPRPVAREVEPEINHNWIVQGEDTQYTHNRRYHPASNVTTVIKLTNHINNTNIVNVPTHINSTNVNNITIVPNSKENFGDFGFGMTKDGPCCMVVKPRTCHTGPMGIRCHHKRHKMCSDQCTSRIMHVRSHRSHGFGGYIPQPSPSCVYTSQWPFVNCANRRMSSCAGCYDHYGSSAYYPPSPSCYGCYDEGFQYGQMYRRGPVLRPHYYHEPPMYYEQGYYPPQPYGYNDYYSPEFYGPPPMYPNHYDPIIADDSMSRENSTEKKEEGDWGIAMQKCKVISDDGSITIANCTVENDHPYAAAPNDFNYPEPYGYPQPFYPPLPQHYPRFHHRTTHKIAPFKNKSNEFVPREMDVRHSEEKVVEKNFPEDDEEEEETNNKGEEQSTKEVENNENGEGENPEDYDYDS